jgi:hypothetical protein
VTCLRRPEVPGRWSANGLVATVRIIGVLRSGGSGNFER